MDNDNCKRLCYDRPADPNVWTEALPLGNGSLGAMVFGTLDCERVQVNQESLWSCGFRDRINPEARAHLDEIRGLLFRGEVARAEQAVYEHLLNPSARLGHYEPLCDLRIHYDRAIPHYSERFRPREISCDGYSRVLDLENALYGCEYRRDGGLYRREAFISYPDQVLAMRLTADAPMALRVELAREDACDSVAVEEGCLILEGGRGQTPHFAACVAIEADGSVGGTGCHRFVEGARVVTLYLAGRTAFYGEDPKRWCVDRVGAAMGKGYEALRADHIADYRRLFDRMDLSLGEGEDNRRAERFFHYGRYLSIASSRPGGLPSNLQGIWNRDFHPMWSSGYTLNINLEMNYWPVEAANLSECHLPLLEHIRRMLPHGQDAARRMFGCRGAVAFHNTDIYGDCAPNESWMPASAWPMGLAWLGTHIVEHYRYTLDLGFAREYYAALEQIALFFVDFLTEAPDGALVTCPSTSPENTYLLPNGQKGTVCFGPAMDGQILRELWGGLIEIAGVTGHGDDATAREIRALLPRLPADRVGSRGQLLEWREEYGEWEKGHRHISHLFALYPGGGIDGTRTPELAEAARVTLRERLSGGGGQTGWSRGWLINLWARLGDGEAAWENLLALLREQTAENLFDLHPPLSPGMPTVFQIDGNLGATAGILEMLAQSREGVIDLLPAVPAAWRKGRVRGLKARGNVEIGMSWEDGRVTELELSSPIRQTVRVRAGDAVREYEL